MVDIDRVVGGKPVAANDPDPSACFGGSLKDNLAKELIVDMMGA